MIGPHFRHPTPMHLDNWGNCNNKLFNVSKLIRNNQVCNNQFTQETSAYFSNESYKLQLLPSVKHTRREAVCRGHINIKSVHLIKLSHLQQWGHQAWSTGELSNYLDSADYSVVIAYSLMRIRSLPQLSWCAYCSTNCLRPIYAQILIQFLRIVLSVNTSQGSTARRQCTK